MLGMDAFDLLGPKVLDIWPPNNVGIPQSICQYSRLPPKSQCIHGDSDLWPLSRNSKCSV